MHRGYGFRPSRGRRVARIAPRMPLVLGFGGAASTSRPGWWLDTRNRVVLDVADVNSVSAHQSGLFYIENTSGTDRPAQLNEEIVFDGDDYIETPVGIADSEFNPGAGTMTIMYQYKSSADGVAYAHMGCRGSGTSAGDEGWALGTSAGNRFTAIFDDGTNIKVYIDSVSGSRNDGVKHTCAWIFDPDADPQLVFYLDGALGTASQLVNDTISDPIVDTSPFRVGSDAVGGNFLTGNISHPCFVKRVLSPAEIKMMDAWYRNGQG